jgi:hypothetical protein
MNKNAKQFIVAAESIFGSEPILNRDDITRVVNESGCQYPYWLVTKAEFRYDRGQYKVPPSGEKIVNLNEADCKVPETEMAYAQPAQVLEFRQPKLVDESEPCVPEKMNGFVPFGFYPKLKKIVGSKEFFPVFITGLSGNGKTLSVEQSCAELGRELVRINLSVETDESDLIGSQTLINGNVIYKDGPVLTAMKRGAVLLLDECDRAGSKLLCLQAIMEGKSYYVKKTGQMVHPAKGFTIIATANTKGQGADDGKFLAQIMDTAFLQRFVITVEQQFPDPKIEKKILAPLIDDSKFVENLVQWADVVRKSYVEGATDEVISTRKLIHIAKVYEVFKDKMEAITLCLNGFDDETKTAFLDLYSKCDDTVESPANTASVVTNTETPV